MYLYTSGVSAQLTECFHIQVKIDYWAWFDYKSKQHNQPTFSYESPVLATLHAFYWSIRTHNFLTWRKAGQLTNANRKARKKYWELDCQKDTRIGKFNSSLSLAISKKQCPFQLWHYLSAQWHKHWKGFIPYSFRSKRHHHTIQQATKQSVIWTL